MVLFPLTIDMVTWLLLEYDYISQMAEWYAQLFETQFI